MQANDFSITGNILDRQTDQGIPGLRIEAWDKDLFFDDLVGSAETDAEGFFKIQFNEEHFRELIEQRPDLYFTLYGAEGIIPAETFEITVTPPHGKPLSGTGDSIYWGLAPGRTRVSIRLSIAAASRTFRVKGSILQADGAPAAAVSVRAVDKDLRHEEALGETTTSQAGNYEISYSSQQFYRAEKNSADLIVRVYDKDDLLLGASEILFNAPPVAIIDLTVDSAVSEFEKILAALAPLLKSDNVSLAELSAQDVAFLAAETGYKADWLQILADAARIAAQVDFSLSEDDETAIFYALGRKAQPLVLDQLLSRDLFVLRRVLKNALDENIIPRYLSVSLDAIFDILDQLAGQSGAQKPGSHIDVQQKRLRSIGEFIGLDPAKINTLINRAVAFAGVSDRTLSLLVEQGELQQQEASKAGLAVSLYQLLDADMQLVEALLSATFPQLPQLPQLPQGTVTRIEDLVAFDKSDWLGILTQAGTTPPDDLSLQQYAALLTKKIEILYPSDALMARLIRADDQAMQIDDRIGLLSRFHSQNPDKEFLTLDYSPDSADLAQLDFNGFSDDEQRMVLDCVRAYQRIYSVSEDIQQSRMMVAAGYDSAWAIARDSQQNFMTNCAMSAANAERCYQSAMATVDRTTVQFGAVLDAVQGGFNWLEPSNQSPAIQNYLKKIAGFEALFGSQDYCKCQHCQSILSPAAYFVDLMSFVENKILSSNFAGDQQDHVLNLNTRRQDLWTLALSCENTHGLIPYLDIINEILENYIYLTAQDIVADELPERDVIEQFVYRDVINNSVRCFQQPVLLALEKLEIYLSHFNVSRGEIATLLAKEADVIAAAALKLSRQQYQLVTEANTNPGFLIDLYGLDFEIDQDSGNIQKFDAQTLLSPMGLTRPLLGELVETQFIQSSNPGNIQIKGEKINDQSVQNDVENIYGLTLAALDGMHRFIRLWRQLSWSISELDLVLLHFQHEELSNGIDADTPLHLVTLLEVQQRFGISVEELCTLWSDIPQRKVSGNNQALFDRLFNLPDFVLQDGYYPKPNARFYHPAFQQNNPQENNHLHRLLAGLRIDDEQLYLLITHLNSALGLDPDPGSQYYQTGFYLTVANLSLLYRHARLAQWLKLNIAQLFQLIEQSPSLDSNCINSPADLCAFLQYYDWWKSSGYSIDDIATILQDPVAVANTYPQAKVLAQQLVDDIQSKASLSFADTVFAYLEKVTEQQSKIIIRSNSGWIAGVPDSALYWLSSSFDPSMLADTPAALTFATSLFSLLKGISAEQSRLIVDANPSFIEKIEIQNPHGRTKTVGCLTDHFNPDSELLIPPGIDVAEVQARELLVAYYDVSRAGIHSLLMAYHASQVVPACLANQFGMAADKTRALIDVTGVDLSAPDFILAVQSAGSVSTLIIDLVTKLLPLDTLFRNKIFTADSVSFISTNRAKPGLFEVSDFNALSIFDTQRIALYASFIPATENHSSLNRLHNVLLAFDPLQKYSAADNAMLAAVLNAETGLVITVMTELSLPATALEALDKLRRCIQLIKYLGVGGEAPGLLVAEDYAGLAQASDAILGVFRAKYHDEQEWEEKIAPYENSIRVIRRDALTDFMVHSDDYAWCESQSDLYYYFLIDVELDGCALTSKVVAAISSLQLYVHRVMLNLEQSQDGSIQVKPDDPQEFNKEWEWRKNYRVWEANRKVFLYPENWIEPELRDNKTPLFEALESELLQQEINEQTVLDAYANYMRGFDEVSHLKIAGAYHDKDQQGKKDILHLFGITSDEPPVYYYRAIHNAHYGEREKDSGVVWSPWHKIDVQIPVSKVSPIMFRGRLHVFWVEFTTRPKNEVKDGSSEFTGYQHKMSLNYTRLRLDGSWTTAQRIRLNEMDNFDKGEGIIDDCLKLTGWFDPFPVPELDYNFETGKHYEPKDGYTLTGYNWDRIYPAVYIDEEGVEQLEITGRDWRIIAAPVDFYQRNIKQGRDDLFQEITGNANSNYAGPNYGTHFLINSDIEAGQRKINFFMAGMCCQVDYVYASIFVDQDRVKLLQQSTYSSIIDNCIDCFEVLLLKNPNAIDESISTEIGALSREAQLSVVNGSIQDVIIDLSGDLFLLLNKPQMGRYWLKRLGTTLSEQVNRALLTRGVNGLLSTDTQKALIENSSPINKTGNYIDDSYIQNAISAEMPDFSGSFGVYYREIFFHIPFLIANHLNSQQKFAAAQKWYHYIFDPTASEEIDVNGSGSTPDPEEAEKRQRDRNWRYIEFRNLGIEQLRLLLTDVGTIEVYRKDPFNPHAIARLRLTAYQKTIVMKYIDNLLDWGDQLFAQDTMESINEATLLYILASDILGERPAELGECAEIPAKSRTYASIKPLLNEDSPFLIEMEHLTGSHHAGNYASELKSNYEYVIDSVVANNASTSAYMTTIESAVCMHSMAASIADETATGTDVKDSDHETDMMLAHDAPAYSSGLSMAADWNQASQVYEEQQPQQWHELVRQITAVFCVPENNGLKQYWNRVEDRLYKIRHCMNISGMRRPLALFAPEIDPGLLVRAKAAGLSIEDVLNAISGNLPPYRFAYVIDRAKSYAATVQGFGATLLSALEKKDVEELTRLRSLHEQNIMKMTKQLKQWEIDAADENIEGLKRRIETVQQRRDYYQSLIDEGLSGWENLQSTSRHLSSSIRGSQAALGFLGAAFHLIPQTGSPFAMKYGGKEMGDSAHSFFTAIDALADVADNIASSAGLEAGFGRRSQDWQQQTKQADHELKELEKQVKAAEIHKDLTKRSLQIHQESLQQLNEVYEFYSDKFSNLGLYTWLSTTLQRLYREAYNSAYSMAKLAEQTYRFERSDNTGELLGSAHWEASRAGLLAGERLGIELQNLERKFIETNYRSLEINQSFSVAQIAPAALIQLRETGECEFDLAEIFFDLSYPGHYRRKIKSARLTIPCVTGPYTNVSATLSLLGSSIRVDPVTGEAALKPVPRTRTLSIATSSAQNDAGLFELSFRDERYMPFEGAGAVSRWKLSLPKNFRQFDYQTISDVIVHISYTAQEDGLLREKVESLNAGTEGSILEYLSENPLPRVFSLTHDFSSEFNRLLRSPPGQAVTINLTQVYLPLFLQGRNIDIADAKLCLRVPEGQSVAGFTLTINGIPFSDFTTDDLYGGLKSCDAVSIFTDGLFGEYHFVIEEAGDLAAATGIIAQNLDDILLCVSYTIGL